MKPSDFVYALPPESIAQLPTPRRRDARLLHLPPSGPPAHRAVADLPELLHSGDLLVVNETRVVPARLAVRRATGGMVELFLLEEAADPADSPGPAERARPWRAFAKPLKRLREDEVLEGAQGSFRARLRGRSGDEILVAFEDPAGAPIAGAAVLERWGEVPLPPYVRRAPDAADVERYQTVYARVPGAVAAPTAGLHFDETLLATLRARGVTIAPLVLHVGPGTFRPLPEDDVPLDSIRLDAERYEVPAATLEAIAMTRAAGGRVVACGTTVVRALETVAAGAPASGATSLFIYPPFSFRAVDALLTNFHLPRSSLLCLVAAFAGRERILAAYETAVAAGYRFFSYGDATFLERSA